jgi:hypothetical protein
MWEVFVIVVRAITAEDMFYQNKHNNILKDGV